MAAKKARKRAYIPPSSEVVNKRERSETTRTHRTSAPRAQGGRPAYEYPTPSLGRTLKRLPVYFLMIFALQYFLLSREGKSEGMELLIAAAATAGLVTLIFAPIMHMMDRMAYNRYQRKLGGGNGGK
jgi:hypothetical protein